MDAAEPESLGCVNSEIIGLPVAGALIATRVLGTLLFDGPARDPLTFTVAAAVLVTIALAASWIPARAATKIEPIHALHLDA